MTLPWAWYCNKWYEYDIWTYLCIYTYAYVYIHTYDMYERYKTSFNPDNNTLRKLRVPKYHVQGYMANYLSKTRIKLRYARLQNIGPTTLLPLSMYMAQRLRPRIQSSHIIQSQAVAY